MSNKQTENVITDYFSELLGDSDANSTDKANEISAKSNELNEQPANNTLPKSPHGPVETSTDSLPEEVIAPSVITKADNHSELGHSADQLDNKPQGTQTEVFPLTKNNNAIADTQQEQTSSKADISQDDDHYRSVPVSSMSTDIDSGSVSTPSPEKQAIDKTDLPSVSASGYEQHKQRLEKMLLQVSAIESPQSSAITQDTEGELDAKTKAKLGIDIASEELTQLDYQPLPPLSSEWLENGRPNWAQEQFDILLIEVNGLQLAVPLVALGQIQPMDEDLTPLFGQSDWFMGLQKSPIGNVKTVNTAKFVMPERYQDDHDYKYVVSINGLQWGLAVDRIHQPISIDPDSIRWRVNRSSRPWMAGMVKDHMCVLLDIPSMGELLQQEDKNHPRTTGG
ncbi:MAG: chemotaxis protein CheW [Cellvibrionaceae bacterium]